MTLQKVDAPLIRSVRVAATKRLAPVASEVDETLGERITPMDLRQWLARLRLLENVPFAYLVPDSALLPPESIRFFYLDRAWTDALVEGALSVGTVNSSDRAELEQLYAPIRDEMDEEERLVRLPGSEQVQQGPAGTITGFLLRSRAVSGWPGLHVRAYREEVGGDDALVPESHRARLKLLRLERLAPAVLLALIDGVPRLVHIEEPRQGIQFGVDLVRVDDRFKATVEARNVRTAKETGGAPIQVSFRSGAPGVLNLHRTGEALVGAPGTNMEGELDGAEFALQMLQFPYRQVFGDTSEAGRPIAPFKPTTDRRFADLKVDFERRIE